VPHLSARQRWAQRHIVPRPFGPSADELSAGQKTLALEIYCKRSRFSWACIRPGEFHSPPQREEAAKEKDITAPPIDQQMTDPKR
jgi:hypothetical protein